MAVAVTRVLQFSGFNFAEEITVMRGVTTDITKEHRRSHAAYLSVHPPSKVFCLPVVLDLYLIRPDPFTAGVPA